MARNPKTYHKNYPFFYKCFPRYREIQAYLRQLARLHPKRVRIDTIGHTLQGRDIVMIVIAKCIKNQQNAVVLEAGMHAREWLSVTTALYYIDYLIRNSFLNCYMDFYIIPCMNPDGYEFTHTENRLWRKNMNTNGSTNMKQWGVDLNRNFAYMFGKMPGSSKCPANFQYRGKHALSEREAKSLAKVFTKYHKNIKLYISLHCYGNLIMFPWGYTKNRLDDRADLVNCGCAAKNAMLEGGLDRKFQVGSVASLMYTASGCSVDYARGTHNIKFAYTIELQKGGKSGFTPSIKRITEIGEETAHGICAMVKYVYNYYKKKNNGEKPRRRKHVRFARSISTFINCD